VQTRTKGGSKKIAIGSFIRRIKMKRDTGIANKMKAANSIIL
jgi:hypothetical protein